MDEKSETLVSEVCPVASEEADRGRCGAPYLIVLSGGIPGSMLALAAGSNWVGRSPENAIQLADHTVSRSHAVLKVDPDGTVGLTDLSSTNGTFVNGERLEPNRSRELDDGDRIRVGSQSVLKFIRPAPCEERYQRELYDCAVRDGLTGLYNRAFFMDQVGTLSRRAARQGLGLAVLLLDLDHFKRVNDTFGHAAGDAVLREVANVLRQHARAEDLAARIGGEEFVLAIPTLSLGRAAERAEHIRKCLADRRLRLAKRPAIRVTASVGVSFAAPDRPLTATALVSVADLRLYEAKEAGRNRVACVSGGFITTATVGEGGIPLTREVDSALEGRLSDLPPLDPVAPQS